MSPPRLLITLLALSLPLCAQPLFECQTPTPFLMTATSDCEGLIGTTNAANSGDAYVSSASGACGFPTQGTQYLIVPANNPGLLAAPPPGGPLPRPLPAGYSEVQIPIIGSPSDVAITWDFYNGEGGAQTNYNDGVSIDLVDPATQLSLLNILYTDTLSPAAPSACLASWQSPSSTGGFPESGTDVILDGPQATCVLLPPVPPGAYLSIAVWNGGDDSVASAAFIDDVQWNTGCPPVSVPNMPNSAAATLSFTGTNCGTFASLPLQRSIAPGSQIQMTVSTVSSGPQPYALFGTFGAPAVAGPGLPTFYGIVDLDTAVIAAGGLAVIIDGIAGLTALDALLGSTGPPASLTLPLNTPATGVGTWGSFQAICADPANPYGLTLTAATQVDFAGGALPASFTGTTPTGNGFYTSTQIVFTSGLSIPFFGALYSSVWVNSCGNLTFTASDASGFSTSASLLNTGPPRIAPLWDDFGTGPNDYTETSAGLAVSWTNYSEAFPTNSNDFGVTIDQAGNIAFAYGFIEASGANGAQPLVGITPGVGSPVGPATGAPIDLSVQAVGMGYVGLPNESIFEVFPGTIDIAPPCGPPVPPSGGQLNFTPNVGTIPGDQGYTAF